MSEEKAGWNKQLDTGTCKTCGGDVEFRGYFWDHVDNTQCENLNVIPDSVKRKTAVCCGQSPSNPPYSEWLKIMRADGWSDGSAGVGWIRVSSTPIENMPNDEAMEFFRKGETPPPMDWEDLPFSEAVDDYEPEPLRLDEHKRPPIVGNL